MRLCMIAVVLWVAMLSGCAKKDPCLTQWGCGNCSELFDAYQKNLSDPQKAGEIKECMDRACR